MSKQEARAKTPYAQPKLTVYGGFSQLTAGGSTGPREFSSISSNRAPQP
jgi:hypothetical protein